MNERPVTFSNPQKLYFPSGYTKGEMIQYYIGVAEAMLPHLRDRPITLIRFPNGIKGESFYEKNKPSHAPDWIETFSVPRREHEGEINYMLVNNTETLAWCANLGAIEFHPFLHRVPNLSQPTHVAFDLDPGEGSTILTCVEVALLLRELLDRLDLQSFPKVSGSKGIQIYVPLNTPITYDATTPFAKAIAELLAKQHAKLIVSEMPKALRKDRVMIDWSQNVQAKTTVAVYSMRGKKDAPYISAPITWQEIEKAAKRKEPSELYFSPGQTLARVKKKGDLFAPVLDLKQTLPAAFINLPPTKTHSFERRGDGLTRYAAKRDFNKTQEPAPSPQNAAASGGNRFVIQKHEATRLHFDFRLEMNGALKSWAVPKGLPYETGVKRSAFEVEDHPIEYLDFEGTIPAGQYGGGTVMVWDIGTYEIIGGSYFSGDLKLRLSGTKLNGEWHIFRIKSEETKPVWLIIKGKESMAPLSAQSENASVLTQRTMERIAKDNDRQWQSDQGSAHEAREAARKPAPPNTSRGKAGVETSKAAPRPRFIEPMNPSLVEVLPEGDVWSYEVKWDGFRGIVIKYGNEVEIWSRNGKPLGQKFPSVVVAAKNLRVGTCLIDGEIVALGQDGIPAFQELQNFSSTKSQIYFYAFDLLQFEGKDLRNESLSDRRDQLKEILGESGLRFSPDLKGTADDVIAAVRKLALEGVVAKRRDSIYVAGARALTWQKLRLKKGQEFVLGGVRPGMSPFESILVGYYQNKQLKFAAKVRPGFTPATRRLVWDLIKGDEVKECPFSDLPDTDKKGRWGEGITPSEMKTLRWFKPIHVVQIDFVEWTNKGHLRHASFQGIRTDKNARDVVRENGAAEEK